MHIPNHMALLWWRHGRKVRLAAAGSLAVVAVLTWPQGASDTTYPVTVTTRDVSSGARLTADDLTISSSSLLLDTPPPEQAVGEIVRGPVAAGEPVTTTRLAPGRGVEPDQGTVVLPLVIADERIGALLQSGDRVDVLVAPDALHEGDPRVVARQVQVLAVPQDEAGSGLAGAQSGSVVLLSVPEEDAEALAGIRRSDHVTLAIR